MLKSKSNKSIYTCQKEATLSITSSQISRYDDRKIIASPRDEYPVSGWVCSGHKPLLYALSDQE